MRKIIDFDMAGDVQDFISNSNDVKIDDKLKKKIFGMDKSELLKVTKIIKPPTIILNAEKVTDELILQMLSDKDE